MKARKIIYAIGFALTFAIALHAIPSLIAKLSSLPEAAPPNRGFRGNLFGWWPFDVPEQTTSLRLRRATEYVTTSLARDGLLTTSANAIEILGVADQPPNSVVTRSLLTKVGIPVDLLELFVSPDQQQPANASSKTWLDWDRIELVVSQLTEVVKNTEDAASRNRALAKWELRAAASPTYFRVATENGANSLAFLRLQLTRGDYWRGPGDGNGTDIARQIAAALPKLDLMIGIDELQIADFKATLNDWSLSEPNRVQLLPLIKPPTQWAQDSGKSGWVNGQPATLIPRYANHSETLSVFETDADADVWRALLDDGHYIAPSRLLFQGGNLMAVDDPVTNRRVLLVGEAEIYRNVALGLTEQQVCALFAAEFGVDEVLVLPAVSFHIDLEMTLRRQGDELVAYVANMQQAAVGVVLCGLPALAHSGALSSEAAENAANLLRSAELPQFLEIVLPAVESQTLAPGQYPQSFADHFSTSDVDSGIGNLHRFLIALDYLYHLSRGSEQPTGPGIGDAYMRSLRRLDRDRAALHRMLRDRGWKVVEIPTFAMAKHSINYLNGIQADGLYIMPTYGGLYAPLDREVQAIFQQHLGDDVRIVPILCSESQRRVGGVHCSVAAYYQNDE